MEFPWLMTRPTDPRGIGMSITNIFDVFDTFLQPWSCRTFSTQWHCLFTKKSLQFQSQEDNSPICTSIPPYWSKMFLQFYGLSHDILLQVMQEILFVWHGRFYVPKMKVLWDVVKIFFCVVFYNWNNITTPTFAKREVKNRYKTRNNTLGK